MSLPREWSFTEQEPVAMSCPVQDSVLQTAVLAAKTTPIHKVAVPMDVISTSLLSIQSAPAMEAPATLPSTLQRPCDLPLPNGKPIYLQSPPDTNLEEDDNLLTISSMTGRPLLGRKNIKRPTPSPSLSEPIDGGYGWFVVFGAFMVQFWVAGLVKSYGVLYVEVLETFPGSSASMASWIPAILSALCLALAPLSSALCQKFSCRAVVFVGGLFCSAGLACTYWATSLLHLLFTFGVLTGIGGGLSTTPGIIIVAQYFEKHRALANGICVSGTAAGSFVFPMVLEHLVDKYGFHGTILLLGGGMLHVCVSAALYRAPPSSPTPTTDSANMLSTDDNTQSNNTTITEASYKSLERGRVRDGKTEDEIMRADNRLQSLFVNELLLNQKNTLLSNSMSETKELMDLDKAVNPSSKLISEIYHPSLVKTNNVPKPNSMTRRDSGESEEMNDVMGTSIKRWNHRSSGRLHSVEDLSTDSTCVYKSNCRGRPFSRSMYIKPPPDSMRRYAAYRMAFEARNQGALAETSNENDRQDAEVEFGEEKVSCLDRISRYLDVSLLLDGRFILVGGSVVLMSTGSPYLLYYLPAHTIAIGHTKSEAGSLVAVSAAMDLCGRLVLGWLADLHIFDRKKAYLVSVVVAGLSVLILPLVTSWWLLAFASGTYGLCLGCWFLLVPVLLTDMFGRDRISSSYGLVRLFQSVGAISVPPLAGYIRDVTGGYSICFYCMGSCMVLGALPMMLAVCRPTR